MSDRRCQNCGRLRPALFALRDEVWGRVADPDALLCLACTEARLGRRLVPDDFQRAPVNASDAEVRQRSGISAREAIGEWPRMMPQPGDCGCCFDEDGLRELGIDPETFPFDRTPWLYDPGPEEPARAATESGGTA